MKRKRLFIAAGVILATALLAAALSEWLSIPSSLPYSARNPDPTGIKALKLLFEERGIRTEPWNDSYDGLPDQSGHTLMIVRPQADPPVPEMKKALLDWVRKGNQVILWTSPDSSWGKAFQLESEACGTSALFVTVVERADNPWFREVQTLKWPDNKCLKKDSARRGLLADHAGKTLVAEQPEGAGRMVYVPEPEIITNRSIDQADNVAVPLGLVEGWRGTVFFDESVRTLIPVPESSDASPSADDPAEDWTDGEPPLKLNADVWLVIIQLFFLVALWLYGKGKRFGAPRLERARKKREGTRHVEAMARWFMRIGGRKEALLRQQARLRRELLFALRLSEKTPEETLLEEIGRRLGEDRRRAYRDLSRAIQLAADERYISAKAFIRLYNGLIRLRKELDEWKTKPRT